MPMLTNTLSAACILAAATALSGHAAHAQVSSTCAVETALAGALNEIAKDCAATWKLTTEGRAAREVAAMITRNASKACWLEGAKIATDKFFADPALYAAMSEKPINPKKIRALNCQHSADFLNGGEPMPLAVRKD